MLNDIWHQFRHKADDVSGAYFYRQRRLYLRDERRRNRFVAGRSELDGAKLVVRALHYIPVSAAENGNIGFLVAVVIGCHRNVAGNSELDGVVPGLKRACDKTAGKVALSAPSRKAASTGDGRRRF
ncbi:MAG TPA: hypothetical protein VF599_22395 [Pyrinomonadaceae bacterium]|jgi:hypothetical protein